MTPKTTAKDFFLQLAIFVGLYVSVVSFLMLAFAIINAAFPLVGQYIYNADGAIRSPLATLVIFFPAFLYVMHLGNKELVAHPEKKDLWIRRWAIYLTLFIAGLTITIDLVTLVHRFLGAEDMSLRFLLKVVTILIVAGGVFASVKKDLKRDNFAVSKEDKIAGGIVIAIVLFLAGYGMMLIGSPASQRARALDEQRVSDLQNIQQQILWSHWNIRGEVPTTLDALKDPISGYALPADPETGVGYEYTKTAKNSFELCATFTTENMLTSVEADRLTKPRGLDENWQHGMGRTCFARTIDPQLYPVKSIRE